MASTENTPVHSTVVAAGLLKLARRKNEPGLDQLQLQKLVYYAHGWHHAFLDLPLTYDKVYAWDYGPVYKDLWEKVRFHRNWKIKEIKPDTKEALSDEQEKLLAEVFRAYGKFPGRKLSAMTHQRGSPWYDTYVMRRKPRKVIPDSDIAGYFRTLYAETSGAQA